MKANSTMYRKEIMELYSEKPNFGRMDNPTHTIVRKNPLCTDEIKIELLVEEGKILDAKFSGTTCFVSTISASVLMENIKGKTIEEVKEFTKKDIDKFLEIVVTPARIKCELLALEAIKDIK